MIYVFDQHTPAIGKGAYISEAATIIGNVVIGEGCYIGPGAILRGDFGRIEIGSETAVEEGVIVHAQPGETVVIGNSVTFGHGAIIHAHRIGDWAVIGMGSILSVGSMIGSGAIVAEGAVVKRDQIIPEKVVAAGAPAGIARQVTEKDVTFWTFGKRQYVQLTRKYLELGLQQADR